MPETGFEQQLLERASAQFAYPPTPDLRARVAASIGQTRFDAGRSPRRFTAAPLLAAAAAMAVIALSAAVAVPSSRSAIAEFFGIEGERVERLPTPPPGTSATPLPTPAGIDQLATPVSLSAAEAAIGFTPPLPAGGAPDALYLVNYGGPVVVLHYDRYELWESKNTGFFQKGLPASAVLHEFTIDGNPAAWISGGNHIIEYREASGTPVAGSQRTVGRNTLVWSTPNANYRIETDLSEAEAVAIAESLP